MKTILLTFIIFFSTYLYSNSQAPSIDWQRSLGGTGNDMGLSCGSEVTPDGGYIICGWSYSNDGDVTGHNGTLSENDAWIVKLTSGGFIDWQNSYGGTSSDLASDIKGTNDGGFIFCGQTYSDDGDVSGSHPTGDVWIVKLDQFGNIQWEVSYGGPGVDFGSSIIQTSDGGFLVHASTTANGGDVTGHHGSEDMWILKLDAAGALIWQKCLGGSAYDSGIRNNIYENNDGSFMITGTTESTNGDISMTNGAADFWMVKINNAGTIIWEKTYGGIGNDASFTFNPTADGGYLIGGFTGSVISGDVTFRYGNPSQNEDLWIVKTDSLGDVQWVKTLGGTMNENALSSKQTSDGGYLLFGTTSSDDFDVSGQHGIIDYWIVKTDDTGNFQWQSCLGGSNFELANDMLLANDGTVLLIGGSGSNDGDVSGHHGPAGFINDIWAVKLNSITSIGAPPDDISINLNCAPNPFSETTTVSFELTQPENIIINIYDCYGRLVKSLANEQLSSGEHTYTWDTSTDNYAIESGTYIVHLISGNQSVSKLISVIK